MNPRCVVASSALWRSVLCMLVWLAKLELAWSKLQWHCFSLLYRCLYLLYNSHRYTVSILLSSSFFFVPFFFFFFQFWQFCPYVLRWIGYSSFPSSVFASLKYISPIIWIVAPQQLPWNIRISSLHKTTVFLKESSFCYSVILSLQYHHLFSLCILEKSEEGW